VRSAKAWVGSLSRAERQNEFKGAAIALLNPSAARHQPLPDHGVTMLALGSRYQQKAPWRKRLGIESRLDVGLDLKSKHVCLILVLIFHRWTFLFLTLCFVVWFGPSLTFILIVQDFGVKSISGMPNFSKAGRGAQRAAAERRQNAIPPAWGITGVL
jgi:hypothetical protein